MKQFVFALLPRNTKYC